MNGKAMLGGLLLAASLSVQAGEIVDTYTSGDTLTATMLDNIKSAVNDNNFASRFYGDGSAGDITINVDTDWSTTPIDNLNFQNVVISSGVTLTVPAGTVIRCTGSFVNNGTIRVLENGLGGRVGYTYDFTSERLNRQARVASPGDTGVSSTPGDAGAYSGLQKGLGGKGIPRSVAAGSFMQFRWGGGAGSGSRYPGGRGGGLVKIQCRGAVRNTASGTIDATSNYYASGSGGGGGGIVVLASQDSVTNEGTIDVSGAPGGSSDIYRIAGPSGGGGGGIAVLVAPSVTNVGNITVDGGNAGTGNVSAADGTTWRYAGGGGGGSGGAGGSGASLDAAGVSTAATAGEDGYVLEIQADPSTMM